MPGCLADWCIGQDGADQTRADSRILDGARNRDKPRTAKLDFSDTFVVDDNTSSSPVSTALRA
jgi:hypothetical protein